MSISGMPKRKKRITLTPAFWLVGGVLLCAISALIAKWPPVSGREEKIIDGLYFTMVGIFLPLLWITGRKARMHERLLMFIVLLISISALYYWFHFSVVTIRIVGNSYGSLDVELREFNNTSSRIKAELAYDWRHLDTSERFKISREYLKGSEGIDIIEMDDIWLKYATDLSDAGLLPLDVFYEQDMAERRFLSTAIERARHSDTGELHGIPLYVNAGLVFYREDLLGEMSTPVAFDEIESTIHKAVERTDNRGLAGFIFQSVQYEGLNCTFIELLSSVGGSIVDDDGNIRVNSDEAKYVLKRLHFMIYERGVVPPSVLVFREKESRELFYSGHALVLRNWPYVLQQWEDSSPVPLENIGITHLPSPVLGVWYLGVLRDTRHPEEAWEVVEFLTRSSTLYARATHPDVSRRRIPADMDLLPELHAQYDFLPNVEKALYAAKPRPCIKDYQSFSGLLSKAIYTILSDKDATEAKIDAVLDNLQRELDR
jgi:multiple sugar transport system substrate-binding protein